MAGPGRASIVHIIAGIPCSLDISQQEIPGTNLSTQSLLKLLFIYFNFSFFFFFRDQKKKKNPTAKG